MGAGAVAQSARAEPFVVFVMSSYEGVELNLLPSSRDFLPLPPPGLRLVQGAPGPPAGNGDTPRQAFWARWNCGELGSTPLKLKLMPPPLELGSGKLGSPCLRMQFEYASAFSRSLACSAGVGGLTLGNKC